MRGRRYSALAASLAGVLLLLMTACTPANPFRPAEAEVSESQVEIVEPANYSNTWRGHTIRIRALIREPDGIARIQLHVNGEAISTESPSGAPLTTHVTQDLYWTPPAVGPYEIRALVQDTNDEWSRSLPITLIVVEAPPATVVAAPTATASAAGAGGPSPTQPSQPTVCPRPPRPHKKHRAQRYYDNAAFVEDVSIPDNTLLNRGEAFNKTWRLRNVGNNPWNTGYELVFVGGDQMSAPNVVNLPQEVQPGATVDITVSMRAPDAAGTYRGQWQLRNPACRNLFGPIIYVLIQVRPAEGDLPLITRFEVAPSAIDPGQSATLTWESMNGVSARLYPDGQSVELSGSQSVSPNASTDYRLVVENAAGAVERTITLFVRSGPAPPPPGPSPVSPANLAISAVRADGFDLTWVDASTDEQGFRLYNADTRQVVATFGSNAVSGAVGGLACGTGYRFYLVAYNQSGESWPSNTVQNTTSPCS